MLRSWQAKCALQAIVSYGNAQKHFLCQATPGAGKTVMAAEVAKQLFANKEIDLVLCFSPSVTVADNMMATFSKELDCSFDGGLGALGGSYTYQSLKYLTSAFWKTISKYRVFAVFDEIHHCSADSYGRSNSWGEQVVTKIQKHVKFTLALTGTPWRSDSVPIALANYTNPEGQIICDFQYSLQQAINDRVCRAPKIVLVDNGNLRVSDRGEQKSFSSISELIKDSNTSYQDIIHNQRALHHLLLLGCEKLTALRKVNGNAGGLVVAASVKHAIQIQELLVKRLNQSAELVTYQHQSPLESIERFRHSDCQWIVSVGMISEGTDIPRLQVCCHVSSVKTELYFRQVLGRILRVSKACNQEAWLYTFAEENLVGFAEGIEQDIPETCQYADLGTSLNVASSADQRDILPTGSIIGSNTARQFYLVWESVSVQGNDTLINDLRPEKLILGGFKQRVVNAFL